MMLLDALRPPFQSEPLASAYKDWLHLNVFDHTSGIIGLLNVSLHGFPRDERAVAVGTALARVSDVGWVGNCEVVSQRDSYLGLGSIGLAHMGMALLGSGGAVTGRVFLEDDGLEADLLALPSGTPVRIEEKIPFGAGWISWLVVPRMSITGALRIWDTHIRLAHASAYFDHNWGRWHWGDDLGWEWGTFSSPSPSPCFVYNRWTDRSHRHGHPAMLLIESKGRRRVFMGPQVYFERTGFAQASPRRIPGAAAALHEHRRSPRIPSKIAIAANDGRDSVAIEFESDGAVQILTPEPVRPGCSFIHEMAGSFAARGRVEGADFSCEGLAVFEHVD